MTLTKKQLEVIVLTWAQEQAGQGAGLCTSLDICILDGDVDLRQLIEQLIDAGAVTASDDPSATLPLTGADNPPTGLEPG